MSAALADTVVDTATKLNAPLGDMDFGDRIVRGAATGRGDLGGVLMFAARESGLADVVGFLVTVDDDDGDGTLQQRSWTLQLGRPSRSTLGPLVANLAAAVSWGDWRSPNSDLQLPTAPGTAELRAALRRGQFRRKEPAGAAAGVRVLDVGPLHSPGRRGNPTASSGSSAARRLTPRSLAPPAHRPPRQLALRATLNPAQLCHRHRHTGRNGQGVSPFGTTLRSRLER